MEIDIPITCKIRLFEDRQRSLDLCQKLEDAGCSLITVHGRTRHEKNMEVGESDWSMIKKIKETLSIPVIANGGIHTFQNVTDCLEQTGVDGVMSSEALLENPALFSGKLHDPDQLALEYLEIWKKYDSSNPKPVRPHLFKLMYSGLQVHTHIRDKISGEFSYNQFKRAIEEMIKLRKDLKIEDKFGWYRRHREEVS